MAEAGRPTELTDEFRLKIKSELIDLDERPSMAKISELTGVPYGTVKSWVSSNYKGFAEFLDNVKRDWKLNKAQENIEEFLTMQTRNQMLSKKGEVINFDDAKLKKIKADATFFVAETLGKVRYSKRTELTGADGKDLQPILVKFLDDENNRDTDGVSETI